MLCDNIIVVFTDASVSPQWNIAVGGYIWIYKKELEALESLEYQDIFKHFEEKIHYMDFISKKSTFAEITAVISALTFLKSRSEPGQVVELCTDCDSVCHLLTGRKKKLLAENFLTRSGKHLQNSEQYKQLYALEEHFHLTARKMRGHTSQKERVELVDKIFDVLDKFTRKKLRSLVALQYKDKN